MKNKLVFFSILLLTTTFLNAEISVLAPISKGAVLQQNQKLSVCGTAHPGETLVITYRNLKVSVKTGKDGVWRGEIKTGEAGGPFSIQIVGSTSGEYNIEDVLVGEVWLFSGQSNMEMAIKGLNVPGFFIHPIKNIDEVIKQATNSRVRGFIPPFRSYSVSPTNDIVGGKWVITSSSTISNFPSLPYLVSKQLSEFLDVPVGFLHCSIGGTSILSWLDKSSLEKNGKNVTIDPGHAKPWTQMSVLYQGLLHPLKDFPVRGFAWYQGESDAWMKEGYNNYLADFIELCRTHWGEELPFVLVQLPGYKDERWSHIRQAQWEIAVEDENIALVVTVPFGDSADIHPTRKQEVADEMVKAIRNMVYNQEGEHPAQFVTTCEIVGKEIVLHFREGLVGDRKQVVFEIAGEDKIFFQGESVWKGDVVRVSSKEGGELRYLRYGWGAFPQLALQTKEGSFVPPFSIDATN